MVEPQPRAECSTGDFHMHIFSCLTSLISSLEVVFSCPIAAALFRALQENPGCSGSAGQWQHVVIQLARILSQCWSPPGLSGKLCLALCPLIA